MLLRGGFRRRNDWLGQRRIKGGHLT